MNGDAADVVERTGMHGHLNIDDVSPEVFAGRGEDQWVIADVEISGVREDLLRAVADGGADLPEVEVAVGESVGEGGELFGDGRNGAVEVYLADEDLGEEMESATASIGWPGESEEGNAVTRASGMPLSRSSATSASSTSPVWLPCRGSVPWKRGTRASRRLRSSSGYHQTKLTKRTGSGLTAGGRRELDGQRGVVDGVAEVGEGAAIAELLECGLDVVLGERDALLQAGDAEKFGGVEVLRRVRRYKANGLWGCRFVQTTGRGSAPARTRTTMAK